MGTLKIKTINVIDFNSISAHLHWLNENRFNKHNFRIFPAKAIRLDFSVSRFLKPYHIAPLACLIHEYKQHGFSVKMVNVPGIIHSYLESFDFDQFCSNRDDKYTSFPADKKTFPLWHISESRKDFYTIEVQKYFENNHFTGQDLFVLGNSLAELMNNVFDHAKSRIPGYTFTQLNTRSNTIITCVCDFGKGIPSTVNDFLVKEGGLKLSNDKALRKALEHSFSTLTRPHNRGFGWNTIFGSLNSLKGKLLIVSNNAVFLKQTDGRIKTELISSNFPGTLVVITLNTKNLPEKEELSDELSLL
jgi:hypothetical protein